MLQQTNVPAIKKAVMVIRHMSEDEKMRELAYQREKALHDEASALGGAGREGRAEERAEMIKKMKASGMSDEQIAEILNR